MRDRNSRRVILTTLTTVMLLAGVAVLARFKDARHEVVHAAIATNSANAGYHAELRTEPAALRAGEQANLSFLVKNPKGTTVRFLQFVHEKPLHLLIVSDDLSEFNHIHPEMQLDDSYGVKHVFPHGGTYRLYADYTPPGSSTIVEQFELRVDGPNRLGMNLNADADLTKTIDGLRVEMDSDKPLHADDDLALKFTLTDEKTGRPVNDLQLYLGALAHFVIISEDLRDFIHAHPLDAGEIFDPSQDRTLHVHDPAQLAKKLVGPSPAEVNTYVNFPHAGLYKLWAQFQRHDHVIAVPFVLSVAEATDKAAPATLAVPTDAIKINVSSLGYEPSRIEVKKGPPVKLAFYRADGQNCAGAVVFPQLGIKRQLPVGQTVVIELTPAEAGEFSFTCGMGMYKGALVVN